MFDSQKFHSAERKNGRNKNSLRPLILILGFFAVASTGIVLFALFQELRPEASAAPGIYKTLNYQGKLEDSGGITVADGAYNIKFTIYDAAAAGNVLWTARESDACGAAFNPSAKSVTTSLGIFSTQLGESGDCPINLDFNDDSYYLGITVGADSEMTPRKRLGAAGYAFNADLLDGFNTSAVGGASAFVPATDSSGNLVLTGNITFDTTTFFLDSTNDNIGIGTAAPDIAKTLDLTTTKKYGIYSVTSSAAKDTVAVYGESSDATNNTRYGGRFTAAGGGSTGVYGSATATGNPLVANYGGYFTSAGDSGQGVYGEASATGAVTNYGGYFTTAGDTGQAVYGSATATGAVTNYGGYFTAAGTGALSTGVYGEALGAADNVAGFYGTASDTGAYTNFGGVFYAAGETGIGIRGEATSTAAAVNYGAKFYANGTASGTVGVYGQGVATSAIVNYGGYFNARGAATGASGVYGEAIGAGTVYGVHGAATDVTAVTNYGGYFTAAGDTGRGVYGAASDTGAVTNYGGYFTAAGTSSAAGVYAEATGAGIVGAVYGLASDTDAGTPNFGGLFEARGGHSWSYGVKGYLPNSVGGKAVWGHAAETTSTNYGGYFKADGAGAAAAGVYGWASAAGTVYGVQGYASDATAVTNYGGYFTSVGQTGRGVYGSATSAGATQNFGGFFEAAGTSFATGVYGRATGAGTVYGVQGIASDTTAVTNYGGYFVGWGDTGYGVYGEAGDTGAVANYGGYFKGRGSGGAYGVYAIADAASGTNYGVYGNVTSAAGWGGYFTGGNGLYSSRISIADTTSAIAYNTIGAPAAGHTAGGEIEDASDLFIASSIEVDGAAWFDGGHTDLAEMITYNGEGEAGDVIVIDTSSDNTAKISTKPYDQSVLGIISTKPTLIITGDIKEGKMMAVAGRVPTKVTNINGAIRRGDLLTTSSKPGYAMKATEAGSTVGKAMGECNKKECTIWVFVNISWYGGERAGVSEDDCTAVSCSEISSDSGEVSEIESNPETLLEKLKMLWEKLFE